MQRRIIESELRTRIDELFRAAGVVIAFPQRDVHLDAARPVPVRVVREDAVGSMPGRKADGDEEDRG